MQLSQELQFNIRKYMEVYIYIYIVCTVLGSNEIEDRANCEILKLFVYREIKQHLCEDSFFFFLTKSAIIAETINLFGGLRVTKALPKATTFIWVH